MKPPRRVRCFVGTPAHTREAAREWVGEAASVAWVGPHDEAARSLLGATRRAVVLDLHHGLDADALAQVHGAIAAGGTLALRIPSTAPGHEALAAWPHTSAEVGTRLWARVVGGLCAMSRTEPLGPEVGALHGTAAQDGVVHEVVEFLRGRTPERALTLVADRGRGKSGAVGRALAALPGCSVALTGPGPGAVAEVIRFAGRGQWVPPHRVPAEAQLVVVDEAAQLPIPTLQRLVDGCPEARFVFATTVGGYEGTGRGFALRFGAWLASVRQVRSLTMHEPIRWRTDDPLEHAVQRLLCLNAMPALGTAVASASADSVRIEVVDRDALAADPQRLGEVFGLLMHAHYRTTPSDLHRMLDAPNLVLHAAWFAGHCVGACLVAHEGGLDAATCHQIAFGGTRLRGHALPETLMCHAGAVGAGALRMVRSVRIAVHPAARRQGIARALIEHVHRSYDVDAFGTLFGAVPEVIRMRRSLGYELVRVSGSRGSRTGEPTAVMWRPQTPAARAWVPELRAQLAREWPTQQALLQAEGWPAPPELREALGHGLSAPTPWTEDALQRAVAQFAAGPRPYESCAAALAQFAARHPPTGQPDDVVLRLRLAHDGSWDDVVAHAGLPSVPAAMRAVKRAVRALRAGRDG